MSYAVVRNAPEVPVPVGTRVKSPEREAMERLAVGDAILVEGDRVRTARDARYQLEPRKFTVRKMADGSGWQVRRAR